MLAGALLSSVALLLPASPAATTVSARCSVIMGRKPGVMEPAELQTFVDAAGEKLIVLDVRNPDFEVEPGDGKSNEKAPLAACGAARARAINIFYDRTTNGMVRQQRCATAACARLVLTHVPARHAAARISRRSRPSG